MVGKRARLQHSLGESASGTPFRDVRLLTGVMPNGRSDDRVTVNSYFLLRPSYWLSVSLVLYEPQTATCLCRIDAVINQIAENAFLWAFILDLDLDVSFGLRLDCCLVEQVSHRKQSDTCRSWDEREKKCVKTRAPTRLRFALEA